MSKNIIQLFDFWIWVSIKHLNNQIFSDFNRPSILIILIQILKINYKMIHLQMWTSYKIIHICFLTITWHKQKTFLFTSNICANCVSLLENIAWIQWIAYLAWRGGPFLDLWCKTGSKALKKKKKIKEKQLTRKNNMTSTRYFNACIF